ncbi:MAG: hypothetical protein WDO73_33250 [Ignavibacteriota bacterium]
MSCDRNASPQPLPVVYHEEDDTIYSLPPHSLAHLVSPSELPGRDPGEHPQSLGPYVAAIEDPARPILRSTWRDNNTLEIDGAVDAGRVVEVSMNSDPAWRATQDGRNIAAGTDNLGFVVLRPTPSTATHIEMRYRVGAEPRIMAAIGVLAWIGAIAGLFLWRRRSDSTTTN